VPYFHDRVITIIGAKSFHGPVRDGKGWFQLAMAIRRNLATMLVFVVGRRRTDLHSMFLISITSRVWR